MVGPLKKEHFFAASLTLSQTFICGICSETEFVAVEHKISLHKILNTLCFETAIIKGLMLYQIEIKHRFILFILIIVNHLINSHNFFLLHFNHHLIYDYHYKHND